MKEPVEFSIITVTYNCADSLEKTILSVINQCDANFEYIIVDGQSTDGTLAVIEKYRSSLTSWISEKDLGIYDAMNRGVSMARGRWVLFLNSADLFVYDTVLHDMQKKLEGQEADIAYGDILTLKSQHLVLKKAMPPGNKHRMYFCHQSAFTRTDILKQMPFDIRYKMSADLHFFKRCYYLGYRFLHVSITVTNYDKTGISNTQREAGLLENIQVVQELDKGLQRYLFLVKLYFVVYRLRLSAFLKKNKK